MAGSNLKRHVKDIAMFMMFLVVLLPVCSSAALAAAINDVHAYGRDGIDGYRAQTDTTVVNVSASIPEDPEISTGQVKILEDPTRPFECTLVDEATKTYNCLSEYPEGPLPANFPPMTFTIQVFNDAGAPISAARQGSLVVDSLPPTVISVRYSPKPGGLVEAAYHVKDEACNKPECAGKCAGIGAIRFTVAGLSVGQAEVTSTGCDQVGTVNLTGLTVGGEVVTKHICIEAFDRLGQSGSKCEDVRIDVRPPLITGIGLFDINNRPVKYTNGQPIGNVKLVINITEDSKLVNPRSPTAVQDILYVNASPLSERPEHQAAFGNLQLPCRSLGGNAYTCDFGGLFLIASAQRDISVRVEGRDEFDNILNETKSFSVTFDNTPPVATKTYSSYQNDKGEYWIAEENNTILMDITEVGSGMSNRYVFLDFSGFGPQDVVREGTAINLLAPNECTEGWTCKWHRIKTDEPSKTTLYLSPQAGSRDDANNALQPVTGTLYVDADAPSTDGVENLTNITGMSERGTFVNLSSGDSLTIHYFVKDHSGIKGAFANFSEIIENGPQAAEGECTEATPPVGVVERVFDCVWSDTDPIKQGYIESAKMWFTFQDYVNHTVVLEEEIEILAKENETPDYWEFKEDESSFSPRMGLDRLSWALRDPVSYQRIVVRTSSATVTPLSITFNPDECFDYGMEFVKRDDQSKAMIEKMGYDIDMNSIFDDLFFITFNPSQVPPMSDEIGGNVTPIKALNITCPLRIVSIISTAGERRITLEETENVSFHVPVFNNALGQSMLNLEKEILNAADGALAKAEWLKTVDQVFTVLESLCNILKTYYDLTMMASMFRDLFGIACDTTEGIGGWGCAGKNVFAHASRGNSEIFGKLLSQIYIACSFVSCNLVIDHVYTGDPAGSGTIYKIRSYWKRIHDYWTGAFVGQVLQDMLINWIKDAATETQFEASEGDLQAVKGAKTPEEVRQEALAALQPALTEAQADAQTQLAAAGQATDAAYQNLKTVTTKRDAAGRAYADALLGEGITADQLTQPDFDLPLSVTGPLQAYQQALTDYEAAYAAATVAYDAKYAWRGYAEGIDPETNLAFDPYWNLPVDRPAAVTMTDAEWTAHRQAAIDAYDAARAGAKAGEAIAATPRPQDAPADWAPPSAVGRTIRNPDGTYTVRMSDQAGRMVSGTGPDVNSALRDAGFSEEHADAIDNDIPRPQGREWVQTLVGDFTQQRSPDNMAMSILSGCISGIFKNLQEWRQIDCEYILCLREEVPLGKPVAACKMEQDYNWCVVIGGNFFSLIPLVQYWDNILSQIQKYFGALDTASGWTQLVFKAADTICDALCDAGAPSGGCSLCELKNWAAAVGQVVADVMDLAREEAWTGAGDKCGKALEGIGEIRDRVNAVEGAQTTTPTF